MNTLNTLISAGFNPYLDSKRECEKVLVVEDDQVWQFIIARALKFIDPAIEVRFSRNANQAFEVLKEGNIDLVVSDQTLNSAKTGLELWDALLEQQFDVPFVLVSGTKRENFIAGLMPYRNKMIPRYIEKSSSVKQLSYELASAFTTYFPKKIIKPKAIDRTERDSLNQAMKKKYYWVTLLTIISSCLSIQNVSASTTQTLNRFIAVTSTQEPAILGDAPNSDRN